jgi:hypothetical protein
VNVQTSGMPPDAHAQVGWIYRRICLFSGVAVAGLFVLPVEFGWLDISTRAFFGGADAEGGVFALAMAALPRLSLSWCGGDQVVPPP